MLYPVLAVLNLVASLGKYAINGLSGAGPDGTIFINKTGDLSRVYYLEITPAGWTFSIWGIIYLWEALWTLYAIANICRQGSNGPAYASPMFIPNMLFIVNIVGCGLNVGWLLSFDRQAIVLSAIVLILYSLVFYGMVALTYVSLDRAAPKLVDQGRTTEIWLTRALVHNGLAMQATWVTVATLLNVSMVARYEVDNPLNDTDVGTMALSILAVEIVVFAVTDLFVLDRYSRYTLTPYAVLVVALTGSLSKNYVEGARNSTLTLGLLGLAGALLITKLIVTVVRHCKGGRVPVSYHSTLGGAKKGTLA